MSIPDWVMLAPFEPAVPCRQMETRPCVVLPDGLPEPGSGWTPEYRNDPCPPGLCARHPARDADDDLRTWAMNTAGVLTVKAIAEDMPGVHGARKAAVVDWLMEHDRDRLAESRRLSTRQADR